MSENKLDFQFFSSNWHAYDKSSYLMTFTEFKYNSWAGIESILVYGGSFNNLAPAETSFESHKLSNSW